MRQFLAGRGVVLDLRFTPSGTQLIFIEALGRWGRKERVWWLLAPTGQTLRALELGTADPDAAWGYEFGGTWSDTGRLGPAAVSPDGTRVVVWGVRPQGLRAEFWDTASQQWSAGATIAGNYVFGSVFSPDGESLAYG